MYKWKFMRMKECVDALMLLMSIGNQDMNGCMTNEQSRDGQGIKEKLSSYTNMMMLKPSRACLAGDLILHSRHLTASIAVIDRQVHVLESI